MGKKGRRRRDSRVPEALIPCVVKTKNPSRVMAFSSLDTELNLIKSDQTIDRVGGTMMKLESHFCDRFAFD